MLLVDHPRNFLVPFVNPFAVRFLDTSYVCELLAVVPVPPFALYVTVYVFAVQLGLYLPPFTIVLYPVAQLVVYVHTPNGADNVQFAPVPAAHAGQFSHIAYNVTVPLFVAVRFFTLSLFV